MIKRMTEEDYDELFAMWTNTSNMGLRSLDDSREGILQQIHNRQGKSAFV